MFEYPNPMGRETVSLGVWLPSFRNIVMPLSSKVNRHSKLNAALGNNRAKFYKLHNEDLNDLYS
jgi:hypothetical protein